MSGPQTLDELAKGAASLDAQLDGRPLPPTPEQVEERKRQAEAEADKAAAEWAVIPAMIGRALAMIEPAALQVYSDKACREWGAAMVPVAAKYGWNGPSKLPELGLIVATAGLAAPTFVMVRARLAEMRKQAEAAAAAAGQAGPGITDGATGGTDGGGK